MHRKGKRRLIKDTLIATVFIAVASVLLIVFDGFDRTYEYTRAHEDWELDEIISIIFPFLLAGTVIAVRQIFILKDTLKALEKANQEIADHHKTEERLKKMASLGQLAGGVAHEINNALQPILGLGEVVMNRLRKQDEPDENLIEYMEVITNSSQHARDIVTSMLAFSRNQAYEFQMINAYTFLCECRDFTKLVKVLPSSVTYDIFGLEYFKDKELYLHCNTTAITQVITNILKNAAQAMDNKGHIQIKLEHIFPDQDFITQHDLLSDAFVSIKISDKGPGIHEEHLEKIFEPFFSTKNEGEGTGLGLSVSYGIIHDHGGVLDVQSTLGEGTEVSVFLPLADPNMRDHFDTSLSKEESI